MARKLSQQILLGGVLSDQSADTNVAAHPKTHDNRKVSPLARGGALAGGPVGAINKSLEEVFSRHDAADGVRAQLANGQTVVELDPSEIENSFISDRMAGPEDDFRALVEAIRSRGQQVPILVRPHPEKPERYQVAYGHRRVRALSELGLKVRAVVKRLSDEELVVAQGQENNARLDLSCIEQATFAAGLEERGFSRATILDALSIDKSALSKLISIATKIPIEIIEAVGRAPGIGRSRWLELVELCQKGANVTRAKEITGRTDFSSLSSDERFVKLLSSLNQKVVAVSTNHPTFWNDPDGRRLARIKSDSRTTTLQIDRSLAPEFADYLVAHLDDAYRAFERLQAKSSEP